VTKVYEEKAEKDRERYFKEKLEFQKQSGIKEIVKPAKPGFKLDLSDLQKPIFSFDSPYLSTPAQESFKYSSAFKQTLTPIRDPGFREMKVYFEQELTPSRELNLQGLHLSNEDQELDNEHFQYLSHRFLTHSLNPNKQKTS
jgi:hypothetical protein